MAAEQSNSKPPIPEKRKNNPPPKQTGSEKAVERGRLNYVNYKIGIQSSKGGLHKVGN